MAEYLNEGMFAGQDLSVENPQLAMAAAQSLQAYLEAQESERMKNLQEDIENRDVNLEAIPDLEQ